MHLLFEEGGEIKAATVLSQQGEAWQVETTTGKRSKIKSRDVLLQFAQPDAAALMTQATGLSAEVDLAFLWECAPDDEFGFTDLANEYFGAGAGIAQQTALVLVLHGAPIYFRRKGRGRYQRAPQEQLQAALAGLERKKQQAALQAQYVEALKAQRLPEAFRGKVMQLLFKPDKNSLEYKAMDAACVATGNSPMRLMVACGGVESPRALHEARFLSEHFPKGTAFPEVNVPQPQQELLLADVQAFSIDDVTTTEIDDAFSVVRAAPGQWRIGIHIAAPALGIQRGDALDVLARARLSTVYFPGDKITMLPDGVIEAYTLQEGRACPALSLYVTVCEVTWDVLSHETRAERITVAHNLRHNLIDDVVTEANLASGAGEYPCKEQIAVLWPLANHLYAQRQAARAASGLRPESHTRPDYSYYLDTVADGQGGWAERVRIEPRKRGAPLDKLVAELMILANSTWGAILAEAGVPGIYRAQKAWGLVRTRMQTTPAPHEGLGVKQYAWSTSPLRRYVDLVNQWQILAVAQHGVTAKLVAPFKPKDADLFAIVADFEATYTGYADHQQAMEKYWCLRWLRQENKTRVQAVVLKEGNVRLSEVPLVIKVAELMQAPRGAWVVLEVLSIDEIGLEASCRLVEMLDGQINDAELATDEVELAEAMCTTVDSPEVVDEIEAEAENLAESAVECMAKNEEAKADAHAVSTDPTASDSATVQSSD